MDIAIIHYHLKPGGVATVIRQQIAALQNDCRILVISGETAPDRFPNPHVTIESIGYDQAGRIRVNPERSANEIYDAIRDYFPGGCDLVHVHNPLLAKNKQFPRIIENLASRGLRLLLQVHDFAEDGRPEVYYGKEPYPAGCHYAVINSRDFEHLEFSGFNPEGLHYLFNMVDPIETPEPDHDVESFVVYPVRAIGRKNIGEAILISLFAPGSRSIAVTLPPNSERDRIRYNAWKSYVEENQFRMIFEASSLYGFQSLVRSAASIITTSISEGFGFAFLEPWTARKTLVGRKLPDICRDFEKNGVDLDHLYERISIPLDWIDRSEFEAKWNECIRKVHSMYRCSLDHSAVEQGYRRMIADHTIDFALLNESFQRKVIDRVSTDASAKELLLRTNPFLPFIFNPGIKPEKIRSNREAVLRGYGHAAYRMRLLDVYKQVKSVDVRHRINKQRLLNCYLRPEKFSLLKWCGNES